MDMKGRPLDVTMDMKGRPLDGTMDHKEGPLDDNNYTIDICHFMQKAD